MGQTFSIAAAHLRLFLNGKLFGACMGVPALTIQSNWAELREIDSVVARQLTPRTYSVTGTIQVLRGRSTGGLEGMGLTATGSSMLLQKYLTIELQDRITDDIVMSIHECQIDNQSWKIDAKGLVIGTFNFRGLRFDTEATQ